MSEPSLHYRNPPSEPYSRSDGPLTRFELDMLSTYNDEVLRGLIHTDRQKSRMVKYQTRFNEHGADNAKPTMEFHKQYRPCPEKPAATERWMVNTEYAEDAEAGGLA